jgi:hypothetical protein
VEVGAVESASRADPEEALGVLGQGEDVRFLEVGLAYPSEGTLRGVEGEEATLTGANP